MLRGVLLISSIVLSSCDDIAPHYSKIDTSTCVTNLQNGELVEGEIELFYLDGYGATMEGSACPKSHLAVDFGERDAAAMEGLFHRLYKVDSSIIALVQRVRVKGKVELRAITPKDRRGAHLVVSTVKFPGTFVRVYR